MEIWDLGSSQYQAVRVVRRSPPLGTALGSCPGVYYAKELGSCSGGVNGRRETWASSSEAFPS